MANKGRREGAATAGPAKLPKEASKKKGKGFAEEQGMDHLKQLLNSIAGSREEQDQKKVQEAKSREKQAKEKRKASYSSQGGAKGSANPARVSYTATSDTLRPAVQVTDSSVLDAIASTGRDESFAPSESQGEDQEAERGKKAGSGSSSESRQGISLLRSIVEEAQVGRFCGLMSPLCPPSVAYVTLCSIVITLCKQHALSLALSVDEILALEEIAQMHNLPHAEPDKADDRPPGEPCHSLVCRLCKQQRRESVPVPSLAAGGLAPDAPFVSRILASRFLR